MSLYGNSTQTTLKKDFGYNVLSQYPKGKERGIEASSKNLSADFVI